MSAMADQHVRDNTTSRNVTERLVAEFADRYPASHVEEVVAVLHEQFAAARVKVFVSVFVERFAREMLTDEFGQRPPRS